MKKDATDEEERAYRKKEKYRNYWTSYINEYGEKIADAEEYVISGICEKILHHAIEYFNKIIKEEKFNNYEVDSYIEKVWLEYGAKIISWGCVGNRIVA